MDQTQKQFDIEKFETALANTPEEVRSFLWSDAYKNILSALEKKFELSTEQKSLVDTIIFDSLTGVEREETIEEKVKALHLEETKENELLSYIFHFFIEPSINKTEEEFELEKKEESAEEKIENAPTPTQALATIQERLSQTTIISPTKRDYSVEKISSGAPIEPKPLAPDPYREMPEK